MTYECIPELVVTVAAARRATIKKIKTTGRCIYTYLQILHNSLSNTTSFIVLEQNFCAVGKIRWHYHHIPRLYMPFAVFHDFTSLENNPPNSPTFQHQCRSGSCQSDQPLSKMATSNRYSLVAPQP